MLIRLMRTTDLEFKRNKVCYGSCVAGWFHENNVCKPAVTGHWRTEQKVLPSSTVL